MLYLFFKKKWGSLEPFIEHIVINSSPHIKNLMSNITNTLLCDSINFYHLGGIKLHQRGLGDGLVSDVQEGMSKLSAEEQLLMKKA